MAKREFTLDDLRRVLRKSAGAAEGVDDLDGDILDTSFEELGYDSLALLETESHIKREHGIRLEDDSLTAAPTPRELLTVVNARIAEITTG
jgi:act minimal PKS acyl carrier protein